MGEAKPANGSDDRLAARAPEIVAAPAALVAGADQPAERVARWAWAHAGGVDPAAAAVLWADLGDWCRDVAEELASRADPPPVSG